MRRILVTGGAGFVGSALSLALARANPGAEVVAADNLHRRGSALNLARLAAGRVRFAHADVRIAADLDGVGPVDLVVECSAEPSALAGVDGSVEYLYDTNLGGAFRCLEVARRHGAAFLFLSTSRVYPVAGLSSLSIIEQPTRFAIAREQSQPGAGSEGIAEEFPLSGPRTIYGATKLAAELLIDEYAETFGLPTVILRCGVIAGPWQMGGFEQGVFTYWLLAHQFGMPLRYLGYGGNGKQVRDVLHIDDLADLVTLLADNFALGAGKVLNVGGGLSGSVSLLELTAACEAISGRTTEVTGADGEPRPGDIPVYVTDNRRVREATGWQPSRTPVETLEDIHRWTLANSDSLRSTLFH